MDFTGKQNSRTGGQDSPNVQKWFWDGIRAYALAQPARLQMLCRLSASAALGILIGIFWFFFSDAAAVTDIRQAGADFADARAFSSYSSLRAYLTFFSTWFFHHAGPTLLLLCSTVCIYPQLFCHLLLLWRGVVCGFSVCVLTGTFSVFSVCLTVALCLLCALSAYFATKCIRYASHRCALIPHKQSPLTLKWILSETAPLAVSLLLTLSAQAVGQLLISCICTLLG